MTDLLTLTIVRADYANPAHARDIVKMLRSYAMDPMGGGEDLSPQVQANLVPGLAASPAASSLLAYVGEEVAGLANLMTTFSSFAARPLVNIHDIVVAKNHRGTGIGRKLFAEIENHAQEMDACKVTLEVLEGNNAARKLYASLGYGDYQLDPAMGKALFWQKRLER
ncbi:Acetyltransferase (GNAT) family protein [Parasphingorhabdus marina DSM 22363]|uniref:Acetyltransferase (GNAT) family protein n=1 Tax=Parasphingorhabdus marina DSM 22363 TaxID=1123272 RepID=A0A1N6CN56_9SPHN|nr:GNAT family N-acetyltransferase [Parasphingorhabdus marina]SIN59983.1 Acetyltransferase (GNAT) family protein [Parasphingorhabdus marina DSM 22363]